MLAVVAGESSIDGFLCGCTVRDRKEPGRLTRPGCPAPVHEILSTISVERQFVVSEEAPTLRISRHTKGKLPQRAPPALT